MHVTKCMLVFFSLCVNLEPDCEKHVGPSVRGREETDFIYLSSFLLGDMRHAAVIRQSVIKRENPESRSHNTIPCDLVFTAAAVCVRAQIPAHKSLRVREVCHRRGPSQTSSFEPPLHLTPSPACVSTRRASGCLPASNIPDIFAGSERWGWGREVFQRCGETSLASILTSDLLKGGTRVQPHVLQMSRATPDCHMR